MSFGSNLRMFANKASLCCNVNKVTLELFSRCSTVAFLQYDKDPGPSFNNPDVQKLLKSMTRVQLEKVYKKRSVSDNTVEYKFMTSEQLEKQFRKAAERAEKLIQMPPIVKVKEDSQKVISRDPALTSFSNTKFVIADITYGVNSSDRKILVRQTDGTLEYAPLSIRKRINQIYFPQPGRKIRLPRMFEPEHLNRCLANFQYEFILDRACVQFDPYEKEYHEITTKVYNHINESKRFDDLRSTRHFGPMAFYFAWHQIIDDLLYDMIKQDYLKNGAELVALYYQLNGIDYDKSIHEKLETLVQPQSTIQSVLKPKASDDMHEEIKNAIGKSAEDFTADDISFEFIETFVKTKALKKVQLELALQALRETNDEKKKLYHGLKKAHGIS